MASDTFYREAKRTSILNFQSINRIRIIASPYLRRIIQIHLSSLQLQNILQGFDIDNQTGFVFTGLDGDFKIERYDNESFLSYAFQDDIKAYPLEDEVIIDGNHYQINSVSLSDFDMYLVAFSSTDSLFQFNHIYTIFLLIFSLVEKSRNALA